MPLGTPYRCEINFTTPPGKEDIEVFKHANLRAKVKMVSGLWLIGAYSLPGFRLASRLKKNRPPLGFMEACGGVEALAGEAVPIEPAEEDKERILGGLEQQRVSLENHGAVRHRLVELGERETCYQGTLSPLCCIPPRWKSYLKTSQTITTFT